MKKTLATLALALVTTTATFAQVGIGTTTPAPSAVLELSTTTKGFLPPRLTTVQRNAITVPATGLTIYNTTMQCLQTYNGTGWFDFCVGSEIVPSGPCEGQPVEIRFNGLTYKLVGSSGKCWLDRNLGATQAATSPNDAASYGDLYQFGRFTEGHEKRNSSNFSTNATFTTPNTGASWDGLFITETVSPRDWLVPQESILWIGLNGVNNPCPTGYRIPTIAEWDTERQTWSSGNSNGAFSSPLKISQNGKRTHDTGVIQEIGVASYIWSSSFESTSTGRLTSNRISIDNAGSNLNADHRAAGFAVRCLKD